MTKILALLSLFTAGFISVVYTSTIRIEDVSLSIDVKTGNPSYYDLRVVFEDKYLGYECWRYIPDDVASVEVSSSCFLLVSNSTSPASAASFPSSSP